MGRFFAAIGRLGPWSIDVELLESSIADATALVDAVEILMVEDTDHHA